MRLIGLCCWYISPWRGSFIKWRAFVCTALAGNHLFSIPINSFLIDVGCIKVNEAAVHLLSREAERILSLRGQAYTQHSKGKWFGEKLAQSTGKTKKCRRAPAIAPVFPPSIQFSCIFTTFYIYTRWVYIKRMYIWHMINKAQPAEDVQ